MQSLLTTPRLSQSRIVGLYSTFSNEVKPSRYFRPQNSPKHYYAFLRIFTHFKTASYEFSNYDPEYKAELGYLHGIYRSNERHKIINERAEIEKSSIAYTWNPTAEEERNKSS